MNCPKPPDHFNRVPPGPATRHTRTTLIPAGSSLGMDVLAPGPLRHCTRRSPSNLPQHPAWMCATPGLCATARGAVTPICRNTRLGYPRPRAFASLFAAQSLHFPAAPAFLVRRITASVNASVTGTAHLIPQDGSSLGSCRNAGTRNTSPRSSIWTEARLLSSTA